MTLKEVLVQGSDSPIFDVETVLREATVLEKVTLLSGK